MKIVIAGASGLVGRAVDAALRAEGNEVVRLVRGAPAGEGEVAWNPAARELDASRIEGVDAIINLAGENIAGGRWTAARREKILRSRVDATATLVGAMMKLTRRPAVFVSASAVGFYGERGEEELTEASGIGQGFLSEVCLAWETHAQGAARAGVRTVVLRLGVVLAREGGALAKMRPLFRLGLGGRMGGGRQWMSWVGLDDVVGVIEHALSDERCRGPVNVVAPEPVRNAEFVATLARVLRRPAVLPVPEGLLRLALGRMAEETLLASTRVRPRGLQETGYAFRRPTLEGTLRHGLGTPVSP